MSNANRCATNVENRDGLRFLCGTDFDELSLEDLSADIRPLLCHVGNDKGTLTNAADDLRNDSANIVRIVHPLRRKPVLLASIFNGTLEILVWRQSPEGHHNKKRPC